jgi:hypothetical protein
MRELLRGERARFCTLISLLERQRAALACGGMDFIDYGILAEQTLADIAAIEKCVAPARLDETGVRLFQEIAVLKENARRVLAENRAYLLTKMRALKEAIQNIHSAGTRRGKRVFALSDDYGAFCDVQG